MTIAAIIAPLEKIAPLYLQESYDNAGLLTGKKDWNCKGVLCTLDVTMGVMEEAIQHNCNLIIAHHPIIFSGLKKINGNNYVEEVTIAAIKNDIAIYAIHTNLDNIKTGVNGKMADTLGLQNRFILQPKKQLLLKLFTFVPKDHAEKLKAALFAAGAGHIGNYSECSFSSEGIGTFKGDAATNPFVGGINERHAEKEVKLEVIFPVWLQQTILTALKNNHPYEEVAYDIISLSNEYAETGSGLVGELPEAMQETDFLRFLQSSFGLKAIRHTPFLGKPIKKVALCGGAGSFLIKNAIACNSDIYISSDIKYHEFFDANGQLLITDIGHYESEQFTPELLVEILKANFPTFAVLKSGVNTNPVQYFI